MGLRPTWRAVGAVVRVSHVCILLISCAAQARPAAALLRLEVGSAAQPQCGSAILLYFIVSETFNVGGSHMAPLLAGQGASRVHGRHHPRTLPEGPVNMAGNVREMAACHL